MSYTHTFKITKLLYYNILFYLTKLTKSIEHGNKQNKHETNKKSFLTKEMENNAKKITENNRENEY